MKRILLALALGGLFAGPALADCDFSTGCSSYAAGAPATSTSHGATLTPAAHGGTGGVVLADCDFINGCWPF